MDSKLKRNAKNGRGAYLACNSRGKDFEEIKPFLTFNSRIKSRLFTMSTERHTDLCVVNRNWEKEAPIHVTNSQILKFPSQSKTKKKISFKNGGFNKFQQLFRNPFPRQVAAMVRSFQPRPAPFKYCSAH